MNSAQTGKPLPVLVVYTSTVRTRQAHDAHMTPRDVQKDGIRKTRQDLLSSVHKTGTQNPTPNPNYLLMQFSDLLEAVEGLPHGFPPLSHNVAPANGHLTRWFLRITQLLYYVVLGAP